MAHGLSFGFGALAGPRHDAEHREAIEAAGGGLPAGHRDERRAGAPGQRRRQAVGAAVKAQMMELREATASAASEAERRQLPSSARAWQRSSSRRDEQRLQSSMAPKLAACREELRPRDGGSPRQGRPARCPG